MNLFKSHVKKFVEDKDYDKLDQLLGGNPNLANEGITIPYDFFCRTKAHPLHRICDGVSAGKMTDDEAVRLAKIFLDNGSDINGDKKKGGGTPLLAAASLRAEQVGIFYIEHGADVHYTYKNDGASALHWAAFCGLDKLVDRLIAAHAAMDEPDREYSSTPLGWTLHALMTNDQSAIHNQLTVIKTLLKAGADTEKLNKRTNDYLKMLAEGDLQLQNLLK